MSATTHNTLDIAGLEAVYDQLATAIDEAGAEKSELEGYEGMVFASATSKMQPGIVDQTLNRIISEDDYYSGCYSRATVTAYGYDKAGNKGVAFGLQNLQKLGDGDRFSGRTAAEDDFDSVDDFVGDGEAGSDASFLD